MKQHDGSWLRLVFFLVVTTLAASLVFAAVVAGVTVAVAGREPPQNSGDQQVDPVVSVGQTFSGIVTDALCGARHTNSELSASECAQMCVRKGSKYIIVDGDNAYELVGDRSRLSQLAGQRVKLVGILTGNTIKVSSANLQPGSGGREQLQVAAP